jgi:hypothetical protein
MEIQQLVAHSRQCSSTPAAFVKNLLPKDNVTTTQNPKFSSDKAAPDFYLLPRLKSALKGGSFCDATDIIKNATEELKRLSQNGFQEPFPTTLQSLAEVCSCTGGLFCRKSSLNISIVLYFSGIK